MRHYGAKRDDNEADLLDFAEGLGWLVIPVSDDGIMDWLCAKQGRLVLIEVKGPKGRLTPAQHRAFLKLMDAGVRVHICRTREDVARALGEVPPVELPEGHDGEAIMEAQGLVPARRRGKAKTDAR